jgi:hypothetical protein
VATSQDYSIKHAGSDTELCSVKESANLIIRWAKTARLQTLYEGLVEGIYIHTPDVEAGCYHH